MNYATIIRDAWRLTVENPKIKWLVFVPSFMAVLIFALEVAWQVSLYLAKFEIIDPIVSFGNVGKLLHYLAENGLIGLGILIVIVIMLFIFLIPPWITGTIILCVRHKTSHPDKILHRRQKLLQGLGFFFRLFEFNAATSIFSLFSIALFSATFLRFFDTWFSVFLPIITIYTIIAMLVNIFLSFSPYFIVAENETVTKSIKKSFGLVFLNFGHTLMIFLLMILVNLRLLINIIVILGVPIGIFSVITIFRSSTALIFSLIFGGILMVLTAYLTAIMTVFSKTVWYLSFEALKKRQKELSDEAE